MPDWFVRNVADNEWWANEKFGARTMLVPEGSQVGVRVHVLEPGKPSRLYHRESEQEGFLVLEGECLLIVEGREQRLGPWDYFHCAPGTTHGFVGAGEGPCVIVTLGARTEGGTILYARDRARSRGRCGAGDGHPARGVRAVPEVGVGPAGRVGSAALEPLSRDQAGVATSRPWRSASTGIVEKSISSS